MAKNAFATERLDAARADFPVLAPVSAQMAHGFVAEAYELTYARRDLPVDPDVHRLRLAVLRRVTAFAPSYLHKPVTTSGSRSRR